MLKVKVRVRRRDQIGVSLQPVENLFVRLGDGTARRLHGLAQNELISPSSDRLMPKVRTTHHNCWTVSSEGEYSSQVESGVEFLPLKILIRESAKETGGEDILNIVYASYNGGSSATSDGFETSNEDHNAEPYVELDEQLIPASILSDLLHDGADVCIEVLPYIHNAECVRLEPLGANDWELLEIHANELEAGSLLRQVCVVYPGQSLPIRLGRYGDTAWVTVLDEGFGDVDEKGMIDETGFDEMDSDKDDEQERQLQQRRRECLRLVADTEVVVVPKSRSNPAVSDSCMLVYPTLADYSNEMEELFHSSTFGHDAKSAIARCPPWFHVAFHPSTLDELLKAKEMDIDNVVVVLQQRDVVKPKKTAVARVLLTEDVPTGSLALHPALQLQMEATPLEDWLCVKIISTNQIKASYRALLNEFQQGCTSADLVPCLETAASSSLSNIVSKLWRTPSIASSSASRTNQAVSAAAAAATAPVEVEFGTDHSHSLVCSGSIIPKYLLGDEHLDADVHKAYTLTFIQRSAINADANNSIILSTGITLLQDLSSLLRVSQGNFRHDAADSNASPVVMPVPPAQNVQQHASLLNLLPDHAGCLKETVDKAFYAIRQMFWPLFTPMKAKLTMRTAYLLAGEAGGGRTHFALLIGALARLHFGIATTYLDCSKLQSSPDLRMGHILDELSEAFEEAAAKGPPSLLILDDLHSLVPNIDASNDDENDTMHHQQTNPALSAQVKLISDHLRHLIDRNIDICVLATCVTATSVAPSLRSLRSFSSVLHVPSLDSSQRVALFDATMKQSSEEYESTSVSVSDLVPSFGKQTEGYTPADLLSLAGRVAHRAHVGKLGRCSSDAARAKGIASSLLQEVLDGYASISQKSLHVVKQDVAVEWSRIGGLFRAKATLTDVILRPVRYSAIYKNSPISLPRGILLYGPSGCGKTLIVPALAKECNFKVVKCNGPELLDKYIGASEAKVRQLFARAYAAAPCILFLDDFDALAPRRGSDHTGVTDRVVNQFLTFLDGVEGADNKKGMVYIIGATSRPDKIDPALLRPGRLEKHVYVGYANSDEEWSELFSAVALSWELDTSVYSLISSGEVLQQYGSKMNHLRSLSAADLKAVMDTAHLAAVHDYLDRKLDALAACDDGVGGGRRGNQVTIQSKHLVEALGSARPSLSDDDKRMLTSVYAPFYSNGDGDSGTASSMPPLGIFGLNATDGESTEASSEELKRAKDPELKTTLR